jgi:hypothetical protein
VNANLYGAMAREWISDRTSAARKASGRRARPRRRPTTGHRS